MKAQMSFQLNSQQLNLRADLKINLFYKFIFFVAHIFLNKFVDLFYFTGIYFEKSVLIGY